MDINKIFKNIKNVDDKELLKMIISNNIDIYSLGKACVSCDRWDKLADEILVWYNYKKMEF